LAAEPRVVGIGASAGGVEALTEFFANAPADAGLAWLVVLHLLPGHVSRLSEIIARVTSLVVDQATDGDEILADHVYVIPPDSLMSVADGRLRIQAPTMPGHTNMPVDFLLSSMAAELGPRAIGVVLSGVGRDGALGLKAIKQADGFAIAQGSNGSRPRHSEMPDAAIAATAVDLVLPVEQMADRIAKLPTVSPEPPTPDLADDEAAVPPAARQQIADLMPVICTLLRTQLGHDFSGYKRPTFMRRLHRRMQFLGVEAAEYVDRLQTDSQEVSLLFHDLLIGVTAFFRDPEMFNTLRETFIPRLFAGRAKNDTVRVWVPGCATGEEAYSLAILMRAHMMTLPAAPRVQIFATDLDETAIGIARAGRYPAALVRPVPADYLVRFFTEFDGSYVVSKEIRELCTFSAHSLIRDPPFSRIDLISCRNVLIYLDTELQARVVRTFHYALAPGGLLVLGGSETVTRHAELFDVLDRKHRVFQRVEGIPSLLPMAELASVDRMTARAPQRRHTSASVLSDAAQLANARVLERFAPAFVVVNAAGEVLYFSNRTGRYLEAAPGAPTRDIVAMARRGLRPELRGLLRTTIESGRAIVRERVQVDADGGLQEIALTVEPLGRGEPETLFLVVFSDISPLLPRGETAVPLTQDLTVDQLERDLRDLREQLQTTSEEHDIALEELKSSNEELHSVNEELQSTNEELETSREEIQSMNEELQTVNTQLTGKVEELDRVNSDLRNLFESTKVATIFLDRFMVIRSFTPAVSGIYNLIPGDIGRPLTDITSQVRYETLREDFRRTMETLQPMERRVIRRDGGVHYLMRMASYRTAENKVDGALLTFVDVSSVVPVEEAGQVLTGELSRRAQDLLTLAIELATRTMRDSSAPGGFEAVYQRRADALRQACALIEADARIELTLRDAMTRALVPLSEAQRRAMVFDGPVIVTRARGALAIGIIVFDLARQAAETGALAVPNGRVYITWRLEESDDGPMLTWDWREIDGAGAAPPPDVSLVELCAKFDLAGRATIATGTDGRRVTLTMSLEAIGGLVAT
jgi:two-component system, chemotaxis family, CheB/CheR fusion protein